MLRRRLAENPNEFGEGKGAVELAEAALSLVVAVRTANSASDYERDSVPDITADTLLKRLDAHLKIVHEVSGKPQERIEHSGSTARTLIVFPGEDSDAPAPALPEGEG